MQIKILDILVCPSCQTRLGCEPLASEVTDGKLHCDSCNKIFPIIDGIPRFVESSNYSSSFGYQWNRFRAEQIDSINGATLSADRFCAETEWSKEWLAGKWILDAGCGAGRFLDVASQNDCEVVGVDISNAVDAARLSLGDRKNVHLVQASIFELPFRAGVFDGCYCIGVIQHTPEPRRAVAALPRVLKTGGRIAVTIYERKPWTLLYSKYLLRPLTRRMNKETLLRVITAAMPVLFPLTNVLFRIPLLGGVFGFAIPVANYVHEPQLSSKQRYDWAILDTFDMLSPQYDQPQTESAVVEVLAREGIEEIKRLPNSGLNLIGRRR